jgi:preprotein translocase subunit YajC
MFKAKVRFALLALLLPLLLNATHILKDDILKPEASKLIEEMATELVSKTGIHGYVVATNENFPLGFNLVEYSKKYEANVSKPYVMLIFAPNAVITAKTETRGRVALIPSSKDLIALYDKGDVMDATIDVIAAKDKNTKEDKFNIGVVQGFSELADQIASSKNVELTTTLPNETRYIIKGLQVIVLIGALLVFWMFMFRPLYMRIKNGKK